MKRVGWYIVLACIVVCGLVFLLPSSYEKTMREGTDEFRAHHALYGNRVKSVSAHTSSPVTSIGIILVNLRRASSLAPVTVTVAPQGHASVSLSRQLSPILDDEFIWFDVSIPKETDFTVDVSAPSASIGSPVGVRFDVADGQLALAVRERIPVYEQILRWAENNPRRSSRAGLVIGGGLAMTMMLISGQWLYTRYRKETVLLAALLLVGITLYLEVPLSNAIESAFGGDAFNVILKSRAWISGEDPFAADSRKAPLYPFLILPGLLPSLDPILWARGVSILASAGTLIVLFFMMLRLGISFPFALGSSILLAVNREYRFESLQGLSNPLFMFLTILVAYFFVIKKLYLVSVTAALAAITRFEGALIAVVLVPASYLVHRVQRSRALRALIPLIIIGGLPVILFPFTGHLGVRTWSDIQSDEGLYVGYTWEYLQPSIKALRLIFGRLWILTEGVGNPFVAYRHGILIGAVCALVLRRVKSRGLFILIPGILCAMVVSWMVHEVNDEAKLIIWLFSFLAGSGLGAGLVLRPRISIPLVCMCILQVALVTAILPKNRYYIQVIPFIVLSIGCAIWLLGGAGKRTRVSSILSLFFISMLSMFVYWDATRALSGQVSDYNEKSASQTVLLNAARRGKQLSGVIAASDNTDLIMRSYVPRNRMLFFSDSKLQDPELLATMHAAHVEYAIDTSEHQSFVPLLQRNSKNMELLETFTTRWGDATAQLYRVVY